MMALACSLCSLVTQSAMSLMSPAFGGYHATPTDGYPNLLQSGIDINNPNVIVVDTSSLATKEEEQTDNIRQQQQQAPPADKKKKKKSGKNAAKTSSTNIQSDLINSKPDKIPQVLIKNVNGQVVITPVPGTGAKPVNLDTLRKEGFASAVAVSSQSLSNGNTNSNGSNNNKKGGKGSNGKCQHMLSINGETLLAGKNVDDLSMNNPL